MVRTGANKVACDHVFTTLLKEVRKDPKPGWLFQVMVPSRPGVRRRIGMRTTLNIEDDLLAKAAALTGIKEKTSLGAAGAGGLERPGERQETGGPGGGEAGEGSLGEKGT